MGEWCDARFVILKHEPGDHLRRTEEIHFDWMFEIAGSLRTFSTDCLDLNSTGLTKSLSCESLMDHRLDYLNLRGDIGRDLGCVVEVASGTFEILQNQAEQLQVIMEGSANHHHFRANANFLKATKESERDQFNTAWQLDLSILD
ncbi:hypothetical protein OAA27_00910 [bacterium]|nr:hypothetical protein [bacterium]